MRIDDCKRFVPWGMAAGRAALGPVLIAGAACSWNGLTLAGIVVAALVSDIYDGVLARRGRCDTEGVRLFDSMADTVFYLCTAVALWFGHPEVWRSFWGLLAVLLALECARFSLDFAKFGRPASYHSYLAKVWGLVMAVAVVGVFAWHHANVLVPVAMMLGILCDVEGLTMSLVMPVWRKDIKTIREAWRLRRQMLDEGCATLSGERKVFARRKLSGNGRRVAVGVSFVLGLLVAGPAFAVDAGQVAYTSGSLSISPGTIGSFDVTSPTALVFRFMGAGSNASEVDMAYEHIHSFSYTTEVTHHLGVLPAVAVSLVKRRERKHFIAIRFNDSLGVPQATIFEVAKHDPPALLEVLRARSPQACSSPMGNCANGQAHRAGPNQAAPAR
jgi:CDP-diacylglycerol--glycerol-3-phosphate 3-phosphatidyltransferase